MKRQTRRMKDIAKRGLVGLLTVSMCLSNVQGIAFADNRVEVGGVEIDGKKVTLNLNGGSLMEAARTALADANVYDDTYIAVSKDAKIQAAYRALTDGSNPLYELELFSDGELQALEDAGVKIVALIQMDQKQAEAAGNLAPATASEIERSSTKVEFFDPSKDEGREILLYQPDSLFAGFYDQFSNQLMNAGEKEIVSADPSTYELSGDEKVTFLFINHADAGRTFNLELNGKSLEKGIKVAKAESVIKGVMSTLDVSGIDENLVPETSASTETGAAVTEPSTDAAVQPSGETATEPSTETAIEPSTEASGSAGESIVILPETGATSEETEIETSAAAAQPTDAAANAETGLPAEGQTSTGNTEQPAVEKTAAAENTGIVDTVKDVIETIAENANATMMKIERRLGVIRAEAAESDEAVVEAPKADDAPKAEETPKTEGTPAAGTENETPKPEETPAAGTGIETPKPEETPAAGTGIEAPKPEETPAAGTGIETPKPEETPAEGTENEAPKTEETTAAAAIETTAAVKTDMDIALENDRKALLKETRAADLVDSSVASARVLQYTLDDLSKSFWSAEITDRYEVNVFAEDAAFTENVKLELKELAKPEEAEDGTLTTTDETLNEKQVEALKADGSYENSQSIDIRFVDEDGQEVEPKTPVKVKIKVYKDALPEEADISNMTIKHLDEKSDGIKVDTVAKYKKASSESLGNIKPLDTTGNAITLKDDVNLDTVVAEADEISEDATAGALQKEVGSVESTFKVDRFSTFSFSWNIDPQASVTVHFVDETGKDILKTSGRALTLDDESQGSLINIRDYEGGVSTYEYVDARVFPSGSDFDVNGGTVVEAMKADTSFGEDRIVFYDAANEKVNVSAENESKEGNLNSIANATEAQDLYLVYRPQVVPIGGDEQPLSLTAPSTEKKLESNHNGTYKLTLSVTGNSVASTEKTKANVIVVFDASGSMDWDYSYVPAENEEGAQYGLVHDEYVELTKKNGKWYYTDDSGFFSKEREYNGTRYFKIQIEGGKTRLQVAQDAVINLGNELLDKNKLNDDDHDNDDLIQMAFIKFGTTAENTSTTYTDKDEFANVVRDTEANQGGTNWEDALNKANDFTFGDSDPTYIIFVSDGNPTFRTSKNDHNDWNWTYHVYGNGKTDPKGWNLDAAKHVAESIIGSNKHLYTIGAFGNAMKMQELSAQANYFDASKQDALKRAFDSIISDIKKDLTYTNVSITDGITNLTSDAKIVGTASDFQYDVAGGDLTDAQRKEAIKAISTATYDETTKSVKWKVVDDKHKLLSGVTYSVSFTVWPTQQAYDEIADLNNGKTTWDDVQRKYPYQFIRSGEAPDYTYSLITNTEAKVTYQTVETVNGEDQTPSAEKTSDIPNSKPSMPLANTKITIRKVWQDRSDATQRPGNITLYVLKDNGSYKEILLTEPKGNQNANEWTADFYVAPGLKVGDEILEMGHSYTLTEPSATDGHYEFEAETITPMLVNSADTIMYGGDGDKELKITNKRRGDIEVSKKVENVEGTDISAENTTEFTFNVTKLQNSGKPITVHAQKYDVSVNAEGNEQVTPNGAEFTLKQGNSFTMTARQKVKLLNVPIGTEYEITEADISGYELDATQTENTSGTTEADKNCSVVFTNKFKPVNITFRKASTEYPNTYLSGVKLKITKTVGEKQVDVAVDGTNNGIFEITNKDTGVTLPLEDGTYTVYEVEAPAGYLLLADPFTFTIDKNGQVEFNDTENENVKFASESKTFTILNTPGIALPETGGMGTLMTTMSGMALMLIALGYLILVKRREEGGLN